MGFKINIVNIEKKSIFEPKDFPKPSILLRILRIISFYFGYYIVQKEVYGNEIMNRWDIRLTYYLNAFEKFFSKEPIIFDVGGHKGESINYYKKALKKSFIYSFEVNPSSYLELSNYVKSQKLDNVKFYNLALGSKIEKLNFYEMNDSELSGFIKPSNIVDHSKKKISINKTFSVEVTTGDNFCDINKIYEIDFLKINVQGMELKVLEGFKRIIEKNKIKFIMVEFDYSSRYIKKVKIGDFENFLNNYNYNLFDIILLNRKKIKDIKSKENVTIKIQHGYALFSNKDLSSEELW